MPFPQSRQNQATARQSFYTLFVLMLIALIVGLVFVFIGVHIDRRNRVSLQWPKITGKMLHWNKTYHSGVHGGSESFAATYTYVVNQRRYVGSQIAVWEPISLVSLLRIRSIRRWKFIMTRKIPGTPC